MSKKVIKKECACCGNLATHRIEGVTNDDDAVYELVCPVCYEKIGDMSENEDYEGIEKMTGLSCVERMGLAK